MKIRILSDLHLEFGSIDLPSLPEDKDTVLVLAGDIGLAKKPYTYTSFIEQCSDQFRHVIYVLGNHEHYRGSILRSHTKIWTECLEYDNVHVLENETCIIDDVAFIGSTLWSNFDNLNCLCMEQARWFMNDYKLIRTGSEDDPYTRKFQPKDAINLFITSRLFIFDEITKQKLNGNKVVVVTHHAPSYLSISQEFKNDPLNGAYATELFENICQADPNIWVHGHTHSRFGYSIQDTRVICNPRGYYPDDINLNFDPLLTITI